MKQLVIIPGGFHPFHKGHKSLYDAAKKSFPQADIYIAATADTSTRPFPFDLKKKLAQLGGIPSERFIEVKSPFQPREITQHYDPENTTLIYVRSEKDRDTSPQPDQTKKNGEPSYLQSIHGRKKSELQPLSSHGYMAYLPTITFGSDMSSSTEIRNSWPEYNEQQKSQLIQNLYPATAKSYQLEKKVIQLFDQVLGSEQLSEKWSKKYKDSIDCSNPKGFSQRAHCQGKKKKQNEDVEHFSNDNLEYIGNCTEDECIDEIFGDVNEFARLVDEYGDEFEIKDLVVKYDEDQDIHHFYWKDITENLSRQKYTENNSDNSKNNIRIKNRKDGFTLDLYAGDDHVGQYTHTRNEDDIRNFAEIFPEYRNKGYGSMLLLAAIKTAENLDMNFEEDSHSLTPAMSRVYDELWDSGLIYGDGGSWAITPDGEDELQSFLSEGKTSAKKKQNNNSVMEALKPVLKDAVTEFKNGNTENITEFLNQWEQISEIVDKAKQIANPTNEDVYDVLDSESCGPFDGGCYLVAKALQEIHGGKIIVLVDDKDIAQHAAVLLPDGQVIDHDGARSPKEFIKEFEKNEMVKISGVREIMPSDLPEASKNIELVPDLVDALK